MILHDVIQYSPEWWQLRLGVPTASCFDKILTPGGKLSAQAEGYIDELVAERLSPQPNFFTEREGHTPAMRAGIAREPEARRYFELERNTTARLGGFVMTDDSRFGCSPDFLTAEDNPGELKCPEAKTHVTYLRKSVLPTEYRPQCHGHLIVTGKPVCHFMSYFPGLPPLIIDVIPDDYTEALQVALEEFWTKYQAALKSVQELSGVDLKADFLDPATQPISPEQYHRLCDEIDARILDIGKLLTWAASRYHLELAQPDDLSKLRLMDYHDLLGWIAKKPVKDREPMLAPATAYEGGL